MFNYDCEECGLETNRVYVVDSCKQGVNVKLEVCRYCKRSYDRQNKKNQ